MNFGFTDEQELLRSEARKFLDERAPLEQVRQHVESADGFSRALWDEMAALGWVGLTVPATHGGSEMGLVTSVVLLEETGKTLFPSPLLSQVLTARAVERAGTQALRDRWLPALASGARIGTVAVLEGADRYDPGGIQLPGPADGEEDILRGVKHFVSDGHVADVFVVAYRTRAGDGADGVSLALIERDAPGVSVTRQPSVDLTKSVTSVHLDGVRVRPDARLGARNEGAAVLADLFDVGAMLVTAESVGAAEGGLYRTTEFANERTQFGSPIGRFQGVKHPLAEMYVDVESVKSLVYYAAWALDQGADDASLAVSRAKAYASEVLPTMGLQSVELHGGIGYTWEYDIQLYLKRARWMRPVFGDADLHYERCAKLGGL